MDSQGPGVSNLSMFLFVIGLLGIFGGIWICVTNFQHTQAIEFGTKAISIGVVFFSLGRVLDNQNDLRRQLDRLEKQLENKKIE